MWVKICGIRDEKSAEEICRLRPDAIGLNFHPSSPRSITPKIAARMGDVIDPEIARVGLFVKHSAVEIEEIVKACDLDAIQLHGDQTIDDVAEIAQRAQAIPIYYAWRMANESLAGLPEFLDQLKKSGIGIAGCLIDSRVEGAYGGTGHKVPWHFLADHYQKANWPPLVLAGGLNADNVGEAISTVSPWGVDVASGVESQPGVKSMTLVERFIENARKA
jgi:phosphoribosylanthranilate isomerase